MDVNEVAQLKASNQPRPTSLLPQGLRKALCTFLVGAAARVITKPSEGFAFLCHVSMNTKDHEFTRQILDDFKEDTISAFCNRASAKFKVLQKNLNDAYNDLLTTEPMLPPFSDVEAKISFYIKGANIKLINATSNDEIKLDSKFNIFVGGNKLGRGVTIKNLLVSYYGRNPKTPRADTVLQHARMYGYRSGDMGVTRLFLPQVLINHFTSIHEMETSLRDLLKQFPDGCFEGLYISPTWSATRGNVLDPNSLGIYSAGSSYNPEAPLKKPSVKSSTAWFDNEFVGYKDAPPHYTVTIDRIIDLMKRVELDSASKPQYWNVGAITTALKILEKKAQSSLAYLVVKRQRNLVGTRGERKGIISAGSGGDENALAPKDAPALFFYRQNANQTEEEVWWPQIRFPSGNYIIAFSFDW